MTTFNRILLVDDHKVFAESLASFLNASSYKVDLAFNKGSAIMLLDEKEVDLVVLDINLDGEDGLTLLSEVCVNKSKVLILSSYTDIRIVKQAIQKGAIGFVSKSSDSAIMLEAIQAAISGLPFIDPTIQSNLISNSLGLKTEEKANEKLTASMLTPREIEVLKRIALEMSSREIAKELYIAKSTVDTHRKNLIEKLQVKNSVGLGIWAEKNKII